MTAQMKALIDSTASLWISGAMEGKPAGVFTSTASTHGGQETTCVTMMIPFLHLGMLHYAQGFVPVAADRQGLATAVAEVCDKTVFGDLMVALGVPIPVYGMPTFKRVARVMLPVVSYFPMSLIF
jgi:hypothetical protein